MGERTYDGRDWRPWERRDFVAYTSVGDQAVVGREYERRRPARNADLQGDVLVPLLQSLLTGLAAGVVVAAGWMLAIGGTNAVVIGAMAAALAWGIAWVWLIRDHHNLLWEIERISGVDLDRDGEIGEPWLRIEVAGEGNRLAYLDLPAEPEQLIALARGILNGVPLAESSWCGRGRPFSKAQFRVLRDELIARGLATWVNPRSRAQGVELTAAGRALMRRIVNMGGAP